MTPQHALCDCIPTQQYSCQLSCLIPYLGQTSLTCERIRRVRPNCHQYTPLSDLTAHYVPELSMLDSALMYVLTS